MVIGGLAAPPGPASAALERAPEVATGAEDRGLDPPHDPASLPPAGLDPADPRARCLAEATAEAPSDPGDLALVRALCSEVHSLGVIGASLAVGDRGVVRLVAVAGRTRVGGPPIDRDTGFRIGSLTKVLTAALTLALVDDGVLELDAPLVGLLPELAEGVDDRLATISARQLLSHAAGLAELWPADAPGAGDGWLAALGDRALIADPGALWSYANVGYALLGAAIERASGEAYGALLQRRILGPLGLRHTTLDVDEARRRGAASGHFGRGAEALALDVAADLEIGAHGAAWTAPAGGAIASAADVAALALGLVDPARSPLSPASRAALITPTIATHARAGEGQAPGLRVRALAGGGVLLAAAGDTGDFAAELLLDPARGRVLVLVANRGAPLRASAALGLQVLFGVEFEAAAGPADPSVYVGDYARVGGLEDAGDAVLEVRLRGGALTLGGDFVGAAVVLEPVGEHRFRGRGRPELGVLTFVVDDPEGGARHLRGRAWVAARAE